MEKNLNIYEEDRPWGNFRRFTNNVFSTIKILNIKPNEELSLQSHNKREEFWHVISGNGIFTIGDNNIPVSVGSEHFIKIKEKHKIKAGSSGLKILEIAFGEFNEGDIVRYEDKYGRV